MPISFVYNSNCAWATLNILLINGGLTWFNITNIGRYTCFISRTICSGGDLLSFLYRNLEGDVNSASPECNDRACQLIPRPRFGGYNSRLSNVDIISSRTDQVSQDATSDVVFCVKKASSLMYDGALNTSLLHCFFIWQE